MRSNLRVAEPWLQCGGDCAEDKGRNMVSWSVVWWTAAGIIARSDNVLGEVEELRVEIFWKLLFDYLQDFDSPFEYCLLEPELRLPAPWPQDDDGEDDDGDEQEEEEHHWSARGHRYPEFGDWGRYDWGLR